jgi:hypothetical protein
MWAGSWSDIDFQVVRTIQAGGPYAAQHCGVKQRLGQEPVFRIEPNRLKCRDFLLANGLREFLKFH